MKTNKAFWVSTCGSRVWGHYNYRDSQRYNQYKLIMFDFDNDSELLYDYNYLNFSESVLVSEDKNLVISGSWDSKIIFHDLTSGKTIKVLQIGKKCVRTICLLGKILAVGLNDLITYIDIDKKEKIDIKDYKSRVYSVLCIKSNLVDSTKETIQSLYLFVGGNGSKKIERISLSGKILEIIK